MLGKGREPLLPAPEEAGGVLGKGREPLLSATKKAGGVLGKGGEPLLPDEFYQKRRDRVGLTAQQCLHLDRQAGHKDATEGEGTSYAYRSEW